MDSGEFLISESEFDIARYLFKDCMPEIIRRDSKTHAFQLKLGFYLHLVQLFISLQIGEFVIFWGTKILKLFQREMIKKSKDLKDNAVFLEGISSPPAKKPKVAMKCIKSVCLSPC